MAQKVGRREIYSPVPPPSADVSPLPKAKPVDVLKKQLRPISLTPCLSKVAEDCVVVDYVKPAVLQVLDPNQYGVVPKSSTTQFLLNSRKTSLKKRRFKSLIMVDYNKS